MQTSLLSALCAGTILLTGGFATAQDLPDQTMPAPPEEDDGSAPEPEPASARLVALERQLRARDPAARESAAVQMGQLGEPGAVPLLIGTLQHDRLDRVRVAAAHALGMLRAPEAAGALDLASRSDRSPRVRAAAAAALQRMPGESRPGHVAPGRAAPGDEPPSPLTPGQEEPSPRSVSPAALPGGLENNPLYISGRRLRLGGILTTTIGGGLGLLVGFAGLACYASPEECRSSSQDDYLKTVIFGFGLAGASLGVGIPLWAVGQGRINRAEAGEVASLIPRLGLAFGRGSGRFAATWEL